VKFADPSAQGRRIASPDQIKPVLRPAMDLPGRRYSSAPVDYPNNPGV